MSFSTRAVGATGVAVLAVVVSVSQASVPEQSPDRLTLQEAIDGALARSPVLQARRTRVEQAEARLVTGKTYLYDPVIVLEGAQRENAIDSTFDRGVRVAQIVELGGKRRRRAESASADLEAARATLIRDERLLAARVRAAFVESLRVRELLDVERSNIELVRSISEVARKRFEAGAVAQMEVNLARVQVGRAERDLRLVEGAYEVARSLLAEAVGFDPIHPPEPVGDLELPTRATLAIADLVASATVRRADLQSFRDAAEAARVRIELERRENTPNLALEIFYGREDRTDRLLGGEIGIRIPLWNRNKGPIAEARAAHRQALAATDATELQVRQEVASALARYRASQAAAEGLRRQVLGTLEDNLQLLQRSFEAGKTGWTDVLVFRREFVDVQRDYVESLTDARLAGIELDLAAGTELDVTRQESRP